MRNFLKKTKPKNTVNEIIACIANADNTLVVSLKSFNSVCKEFHTKTHKVIREYRRAIEMIENEQRNISDKKIKSAYETIVNELNQRITICNNLSNIFDDFELIAQEIEQAETIRKY